MNNMILTQITAQATLEFLYHHHLNVT